MPENTPIQKVLEGILTSQSYDELQQFTDETSWTSMSSEERDLLAQLFVLAAESEMKEMPESHSFLPVKKALDAAVQLSPLNARVWYRRGLVLANGTQDVMLQEACICFEKALSLNTTFFDAWYAWANVLMRRGIIAKEQQYLLLADDKFQRACEILLGEGCKISDEVNKAEFYWHWGLLAFMIGRASGEANDLYRAITHYQKAESFSLEKKDFFNDYANALVEFAVLVNRHALIFDAIELYKKSLENPENEKPQELAVRYLNIGLCYQYLFEFQLDEQYFQEAQESYEKSLQMYDSIDSLWSNWADLLLFAAKFWQDVTYIESAIDKFAKAGQNQDPDPIHLAHFVEALVYLGSHAEHLGHLRNAQKIATSAVQDFPTCVELWTAYGLCLYELGKYFNEERFFYEAIEKLERGSILQPKYGMLWHVLALTKYALGEMKCDIGLIEESLLCFAQCSKSNVGRFGYFWNDWGITLLNIADVTHEKKQIEEAMEKFEQAILLHEYIDPQWMFNYGCALDFLGDITDDESAYERAIQAFTHALTHDPTLFPAKYHLGLSLMHLGEMTLDVEAFRKAQELFEQVIAEDPEDESAWNDSCLAILHIAQHSSDAHEKQELYLQAEKCVFQSLQLGNPLACYNAACLYALQKNHGLAMHYLEKGRELNALPPAQDLIEDEWMDNMRGLAAFEEFVKHLGNDNPDDFGFSVFDV